MAPVQLPMPSARTQKLTAVMMADMVGYSRMLERDESRNSNHAARSIELFKSLIGSYGGSTVNIAGDGILAFFDSAELALRFAVLIQAEFREQAFWEDGEPIQFRIGVALGEVARDSELVQAHCVNVAARIQALADPGGIVVTDSLRAAIRNVDELSFRPLGPRKLKNIAKEVDVFELEATARTEATSIQIRPRDQTPAPEAPERLPSIAVLALTNLTGDESDDYLSAGIVEGIISDLSRFRSLLVIARHSAFLFSLKTRSARDIGRNLGASYLLCGSLQRAGKHLRIVVELVDVESEAVIWSDRFNSDLDRLFEVQDEISGAVASRLAVQIDFAEHRRESSRPSDLRSYGLVLRGQHMILRISREAISYGRSLFEEAIKCAPSYARAHSAASRTHNLDWRYSWSDDPAASLETAVETARRAIQLDRLDSRGFAELGFANLYKKRVDEALADYGRALALNPNDADVITEYADALAYAGQPARAVELIERSMRLNPYHPDWYLWCLADAQDALGQSEAVIETVHRMQNPDEGRRLLAANLSHLGMVSEARAEAEEILRLYPEFRISVWSDRTPYREAAVLERFVEGLRRAGLPD